MEVAPRLSRELVLGYLERISSRAFSDFPDELTDLAGNQHGVYALYKGDRLYYVGLWPPTCETASEITSKAVMQADGTGSACT